jgi:peptidoglycan/LPS O-acetylase OafA/YrhL
LPALLLVTVVDGLIFVTNHSYFVQLFTHCQNPTVSNFAVNLLMLEHFPVEFFNGILSVFSLKLPLINFATYGFDGPLWALPIEWWLYMLFGWVSIQVLGKRKNKVVFFTIAILLSLMVLGNAWVENGAYVSLTIAWFLGVLMTLAISNENLNRLFERKYGIKLLGLALFLLLAGTTYAVFRTFAYTHLWYDVGLGIMLSACLFASVLYLNNAGRSSGNWLSKRFAGALTIGAGYSYTLYLIHFPIILLFNGINLQTDRWLMIGFILLITNVIAYSVAHFTEKRHKQLGKMIKHKLNISE